MNSKAEKMGESIVLLGVLVSSLAISSCGGGGYTTTAQQTPSPNSFQNMQGAWEIIFHSTVSPNDYAVLETNLTQVGTHVFAGAPAALIYQAMLKSSPTPSVKLSRFGGRCDSNGTDEVTFDGTIASPTASPLTIEFMLTETGVLGSAVTSASVPAIGAQISGNYSTPAACGFPEDHGTFTGRQYSWRLSIVSLGH